MQLKTSLVSQLPPAACRVPPHAFSGGSVLTDQRSNKNKPSISFVRVEFNGIVLGDSQKLNAPVDDCVNYNFTCSFECSDVGHTLDDLAHKPVILTVIEVLQKEKKQKEEKTAVLGQAVVDLLPLLRGQWSFSSTVVLHSSPGSPPEIVSQDGGLKPTLEVTVSVPEPLLSDSQLSESNLLTVTIEAAYSVPDFWNLASNYVAALQVPHTAEKEQILLFSNGVLKMPEERETVPKPKKWPIGPLLVPDAQFIPDTCTEGDLEHGDLTNIEDREFRAEAECNRRRVSWDTERRCFIDAGGVAWIVECRLWPVEVMRSPQTGVAKVTVGKTSKEKLQVEDEIHLPFHAVAYVDFAPLLHPGAKCIRGAYMLHPFYDSEILLKTKRNASVLRETMNAPAAQGRPRPSSSVGSCKTVPSKIFETQKAGRDNKEMARKPGTQGKLEPSESITNAEPLVNAEGQMYADSRSYIVIKIALEKPLVPKRPPEELAKRVMELIPPRPVLPRRPAGAERAVQEFQMQIASVTSQVLEQYLQMYRAAFVPGGKPLDPATQEQRKRQLFGELNCSGKYFAFKEQMKYSVVRIVREKMLRTEAFTDQEQLQAFLSDLYVFLVDEMHIVLNKTLSASGHKVQPQPLLDCGQLRHFAKEAQLNENYQLAAQYYQELLARDRNNPSHWFDYGVFYMLTADYLKAEECFHLGVSINQVHVPSLLMCGILSERNGLYEDAETLFEAATSIEPSCVVAWTLYGLFYLAQENIIRGEMAFAEATKQLRAALVCRSLSRQEIVDGIQTPTEGGWEKQVGMSESLTELVDKPAVEIDSDKEEHRAQSSKVIKAEDEANADPETAVLQQHQSSTRLRTTIYMETVTFLLQNYALQMAQRALAQELLCPDGGPSSPYQLALAHVQLLQGKYSSAENSLQEALSDSFQNPDAWALYGHLKYLMEDYNQAQKCYERTLDFVMDASDAHLVYLRLGFIYLRSREYDKAKTTYLCACKSSPSCLTWLGVGIACYRLGELTEAEDALSEANTLHNGNPEVWGYLSLVCLQTGRKLEAEQSYKYALKFNLPDGPLLQEIRELQHHVGFGRPSFP